MATSGEKRWPRMGRNRWPLTETTIRLCSVDRALRVLVNSVARPRPIALSPTDPSVLLCTDDENGHAVA